MLALLNVALAVPIDTPLTPLAAPASADVTLAAEDGIFFDLAAVPPANVSGDAFGALVVPSPDEPTDDTSGDELSIDGIGGDASPNSTALWGWTCRCPGSYIKDRGEIDDALEAFEYMQAAYNLECEVDRKGNNCWESSKNLAADLLQQEFPGATELADRYLDGTDMWHVVQKIKRGAGFFRKFIKHHYGEGGFGYVTQTDGVVRLVFAGTGKGILKSLDDWKNNLFSFEHKHLKWNNYNEYFGRGRLALGQGFRDQYDAVYAKRGGLRDAVNRYFGSSKWHRLGQTVHVYGHSLGGAVASVAAVDLALSGYRVVLHTAGAPRVFNDASADAVQRVLVESNSGRGSPSRIRIKTHRWANWGDPIVTVPWRAWRIFGGGLKHYGNCLYAEDRCCGMRIYHKDQDHSATIRVWTNNHPLDKYTWRFKKAK